ncbi:Zinc finger LIM-type [Trinorchestia longiramus]|nr:Zinc finger LIM-type [Trinorchestia longiramus]
MKPLLLSQTEDVFRKRAERTGRLSVCRGCDVVINDQYILRVAPDMEWHAACLKCADCHQFLDEYCTCFVREGRTYCKRDYVRLFGAKCDKCLLMFDRKDLVMRARSKIYHLDCFRCVACSKQLLPGDEFALREDGLYCKQDFDAIEKKANAENNNTTNINHNEVKASDSKPLRKERREGKTTRVRTVLNEKQLQTLSAICARQNTIRRPNSRTITDEDMRVTSPDLMHCRSFYASNPRPDSLLKEEITRETGLPMRVVRVWYQNKRFKDKRRARIEQQRALLPQVWNQLHSSTSSTLLDAANSWFVHAILNQKAITSSTPNVTSKIFLANEKCLSTLFCKL